MSNQETWEDLKSSPQWDRIQEYGSARARGPSKRITELEAQAATLRQQVATVGQDALAGGDALIEAERLKSAVAAFTEAFQSRLPESARTIVPTGLPADELVLWLGANQHMLTASPPPTQIHGGAPRRPPGPISDEDSRRIKVAEVAQRIFGGR